MANFAELSCFNKLLLDKMKRMEQKHKEEMEKLKKENENLEERLENAHYFVAQGGGEQCIDCCLYYDSDGLEFGEYGSGIRCRECDIKNEKEK